MDRGVFGVGYGNGPLDRPGWDGHLVIRCDKFQAPVMIGLSIDQSEPPAAQHYYQTVLRLCCRRAGRRHRTTWH